jgi:glucose/arabinose dehydrogenase
MTATNLLAILIVLATAGSLACSDEQAPAATAMPPSSEAAITLPPQSVEPRGNREPAPLAQPDPRVQFERGVLTHPSLSMLDPTSLAFGPDGRLYAAQLGGEVWAITLDGTNVIAAEQIVPAGVLQNILGIAFNPHDAPDPVRLYVSHTVLFSESGNPFTGTVSRLTGPAFEREDLITGLTVSNYEHGTNGLAFDADGRLLIAQGGMTNAGVPSERHTRSEMPLSSAILVANIADPSFNGAVTYEPAGEVSTRAGQTAGDVRVYAAGFRNPFDIVVHSNGRTYATDNGPNPDDGKESIGCEEAGPGPWAPDELNLILEGEYYGFPNRNRGRLDERQCTYRMPDDATGESTPPLATLGYSTSSNGLAEYVSDAFGGLMRGDLVYVEWVKARAWRVELAPDGLSVTAISQLHPEEFDEPLDIAVGPDGTLFISELGAERIAFLRPSDVVLLE